MNNSEQYQLFADEFTPADQPFMAEIRCGDTSWARAATHWITGSDVIDSIERHGTSVWIYRDIHDAIVGFAALAATQWQKWPPPDGKRSRLLYIPQIGIDIRYHGFPPDQQWRYSHQIMEHLIFKARQLALEIRDAKPPSKHVELLTLKVHRENIAAQKLYERYGFVLLESFEDDQHVVMSHRLDLESGE